MEEIRLFLLSISLLIVGFLIYPTAMDLLNPFLNILLTSDKTSVFEKFIYASLPIILVFGIILYSVHGGLQGK